MAVRLAAALFAVWLSGCGASNAEAPPVAPSKTSSDDGHAHYVRGKRALRAGRLSDATRELERALALLEGNERAQQLTREEIHYALGEAAVARFELGPARRHFEAAAAINRKLRPPNDAHTLEVLEALAIVIDYARDYPEAEARFRDLIPRVEAVRGAKSIELARLELNLAVNLGYQGRDSEVEPLLQKSIPIFEARHDDDALAHALNALGTLLYRKGELSRARETLQRALAVRERLSGPDHPNVATILFNLCGIDLDEGKLGLAEKSCGRSLSIRKKSLPENHPFRRDIDQRYAEVERRLGKRQR